MKEKMLVDAYTFFEEEDEQCKQEMEAEDLLVDIACKFINYRAKNKLSQKELAEKLQMTQAMVSKLESGEYNPTVKMLFEISKKLSWTFSVRLENGTEDYMYQFEQTEPMISVADEEYIDGMGFAS